MREEAEGLVRDVVVRELGEDRARRRSRDREAHPRVGDVRERDPARRQVRAEPTRVPVLQVVGAGEPEPVVVEARDGEVAHQPSGLVQHGREPDRPDRRDAARHQPVEPGLGPGSAHLVACVLRDLVRARRRADRLDLLAHDGLGVRAPQRVVLLEVRPRREVERHLQSPVHREPRARRTELVVARRRLERTPRRELLVRVGHHEAACVELRRRRAQVPVVRRVRAEPRDVHAEDVVARVAVGDPVRDARGRCRRTARSRPCTHRPPSSSGRRRPARRAGCRPA